MAYNRLLQIYISVVHICNSLLLFRLALKKYSSSVAMAIIPFKGKRNF